MTKFEMVLNESRSRKVQNTKELFKVMEELGVKSGAIFNKVKDALDLGMTQKQMAQAGFETNEDKKAKKEHQYDEICNSLSKEDLQKMINNGQNDDFCWYVYKRFVKGIKELQAEREKIATSGIKFADSGVKEVNRMIEHLYSYHFNNVDYTPLFERTYNKSKLTSKQWEEIQSLNKELKNLNYEFNRIKRTYKECLMKSNKLDIYIKKIIEVENKIKAIKEGVYA